MRVWRRVAVFTLTLFAVLALGAYAARHQIVAYVAKDLLSRPGQPDAVLEVIEVSPRRTRLAGVASAGLTAEAVTLHYEPLAILSGEISRIEIEGARFELDLTRPGDDGAFEVPTLPPVQVEAGQLALLLPQGRIQLAVEAALETAPDGQLDGTASFGGRSGLGSLDGKLRLESGELSLELAMGLGAESPLWPELGLPDPEAGELRAELTLAASPSALDGLPDSPSQWLSLATASDLAGDLRLESDGLQWIHLGRPVSFALPLAFRSETGGLEVTLPSELDLTGLPDLRALAGDQEIAAELLQSLTDTTRLALGGDEGAVPVVRLAPEENGAVLSFAGRLAIEAAGREGLALAGRANLKLDPRLRPGAFRVDALQAVLRDLTLGGRRVEALSFDGSLAGDAGTLRAEGDLRAALRDLRIDAFGFGAARFEGPLALGLGPEGATAALTGDGTLSWDAARSSLAFALPEAHRLRLTGLRVRQEDAGLTYEAEADPGEMTFRIDDPDSPLDLRTAFQPLRIAGRWSEAEGLDLEARIPVRRLAVPQLELEAREVLATETLQPAKGIARVSVTVAELRQTGDAPVVAPIKVRGRLDHGDAPLTFTAEGSTLAGARLFALQGRHDIDRGSGSAELSLAEDLFGPAPRALPELLPAAPEITVTGGKVEGEASFGWRDGGLSGSGRLLLSEVALKSPALTLEGLEGELAFAQLFPLRSEPGQVMTARRLDLGETLSDISARFAVSAQGPEQALVIDIEKAEARSILGPLSVTGGRAEPQSGRYRLPLQLADLDLGKLSKTAAIEGLDGEGHLSGLIPLEIAGAQLRIADASLTNRDSGVLRFRSETASKALAAGGEPVELMLQALEDFRYDELKLSANTADGKEELELFVTTLGKNPAVLEGHPFRFNIRLTSNLPQLVEVLRQGDGLTKGVLGKLWKFQP